MLLDSDTAWPALWTNDSVVAVVRQDHNNIAKAGGSGQPCAGRRGARGRLVVARPFIGKHADKLVASLEARGIEPRVQTCAMDVGMCSAMLILVKIVSVRAF